LPQKFSKVEDFLLPFGGELAQMVEEGLFEVSGAEHRETLDGDRSSLKQFAWGGGVAGFGRLLFAGGFLLAFTFALFVEDLFNFTTAASKSEKKLCQGCF
jgi:hypothetical protein